METTKIKNLKEIFEKIRDAQTREEKIQILFLEPLVQKELERERLIPLYLQLDEERQLVFLLMALFEQGHLLHHLASQNFLSHLVRVDFLYQEIGGLFGYFLKAMKIEEKKPHEEWVEPKYLTSDEVTLDTIFLGCKNLSKTGVMVPLGGMGQRLGYRDEEGPRPVAQFPFLGHSLLEQIVRDLEGLEALYQTLFGEKIEIPLILMCSKEKSNETKVKELLEHECFFRRKKILLLAQDLVPVITEEGHFSFDGTEFLCFPSGHGAIWKLIKEEKALEWLESIGINYLIIRQINNPLAALDTQICSFLGACIEKKSCFGLVGLERIQGLSEGVLVEKRIGKEHFITNVEYVEIADTPIQHDLRYLANANILFAEIRVVKEKLNRNFLCGLIVNRKHHVPQFNKDRKIKWVKGAAVEGMMQNLVELFSLPLEKPLPVLVMRMEREKIMSAIKTLEGERETPTLASYNFLKNSYKLLVSLSKKTLKEFSSLEDFEKNGANYTFIYHPSLGPFYQRIRNKVSLVEIDEGSFLQLEIEKFFGEDLIIHGNLKVRGIQGICTFNRVKIEGNCTIEIEEGGELFAEDLTLLGEQLFRVSKNSCKKLVSGSKGEVMLVDGNSMIWEEEEFCQLFHAKKQS